MQMDRQWMYVGDRRGDPYMTGLRSFLEVAKANTKDGFISCPCFDCENTKSLLYLENHSHAPSSERFHA